VDNTTLGNGVAPIQTLLTSNYTAITLTNVVFNQLNRAAVLTGGSLAAVNCTWSGTATVQVALCVICAPYQHKLSPFLVACRRMPLPPMVTSCCVL
jgi:hypothetical protein